MTEKGILFKAEMVRALLNTKPGTWPAEPIDPSKPFKWQTRRIIKPGKSQDWLTPKVLGEVVQMVDRGDGWWAMSVDDRPPGPHGTCPGHIGSVRAPYQVGDILWVRESMRWSREGAYAGYELSMRYMADNQYVDMEQMLDGYCPPRNGRHTDNWGSGDDHLPEGAQWGFSTTYGTCPSLFMPRWASRIRLEVMDVRAQRLQNITEEDAKAEGCQPWQYDPMQPMTTGEMGAASPYRGGYACLWDEINDERATWKSNPWIWAYSFKRLA